MSKISIRNIPVLCYHDIGTPGRQSIYMFKKHLEVIKKLGFKTISASHLYKIITGQKKLDDKYILLTFDDCHISNWLYTIPILAQYNMHGVFFAITDFIKPGAPRVLKKTSKLTKLSHAFRMALKDKDFSQFMNQEELKAAIQDFGMEIYSHTSRHQGCFINTRKIGTVKTKAHWSIYGIYKETKPNLPVFKIGSAYAYNGYWPNNKSGKLKFYLRSNQERYQFCLADFKRSYQIIQSINEARIQFLCWPWGHFDSLSTKALKQAGFQGAFTLERFYNGPGINPFKIHRIGVAKEKDEKWLKNRLIMHTTSIGATIFFKFFRKKS